MKSNKKSFIHTSESGWKTCRNSPHGY